MIGYTPRSPSPMAARCRGQCFPPGPAESGTCHRPSGSACTCGNQGSYDGARDGRYGARNAAGHLFASRRPSAVMLQKFTLDGEGRLERTRWCALPEMHLGKEVCAKMCKRVRFADSVPCDAHRCELYAPTILGPGIPRRDDHLPLCDQLSRMML